MFIQKIWVVCLILVLLCTGTSADEDFVFIESKYNQAPTLYIGPLSRVFWFSIIIGEVSFLSSTMEYPLSGFHSLIVNPSVYGGIDYFRLGSGVGVRRFLNGEADGFYLQLMSSVYYGRAVKNHYNGDSEVVSGSIIDVLGYAGYSAKGISCPKCYKIFFDIGAGYGWGPFSDIPSNPLSLGSAGHKGMSIDINLGISHEFQSHPNAAVANKNLEVNKKTSIYLHPISLLTGLCVGEAPFILYLTGEYPLNEYYSLILSPSLWTGGNDEWMGGSDYFKLGSGVGIRRFIYGEASGHYLQLMPSAHYLRYQAWHDDDVKRKVSGPKLDVIGYIGYSAKYYYVSIFFEAGMGYRWSFLPVKYEDWLCGSSCKDFSKSLTFDANMGLGFPF
jgi:hypothetical protein